MDRAIVYSGALPQTIDILNTNKMGQVGLSYALRGILGGNTVVHNLACLPTSPASLQVTVGVGAIYTLDTMDATAYSDLGLDQHQIIKQGLLQDLVTLTITPPGTPGQSQVFLVEAILSDIDIGNAVLPYYNATNPSAPFSGPGNNGMGQYTTRSVQCTIALKAGIAAATGSQVTPAPDAGYTGLYAITVVNGQTAITSGNIVLQPTAPFFPTLPAVPNDVQTSAWTYAVDTGVLNAMVATLYPPITSLVPGTAVLVRAAFGNTGTATLNVNGTGNQPVHRANGANLSSGDYNAGEILAMVWDGSAWQIINFFGFTATTTNNNTFTLSIPFAVDSGSINSMTGLFSPALTSLAAGQTVEVQVSNTNTGDSTLICNALAAKGIRQNGVVLQSRALVAGQIVVMVYDGTFFQIINARWPYYIFDTSSPPGTDLAMAVGDQVTITFTNATLVPLKIATVPGVYEIEAIITSVTATVGHDSDPALCPNNAQVFGNANAFWNSSTTGATVSAGGSGTPVTTQPAFPYVTESSYVQVWNDFGNMPNSGGIATSGMFGCMNTDMFGDAEVGIGVNYTSMGAFIIDFGPMILKMTISTFTVAKMAYWSGALNPTAMNGWSRWFDTSTPWTSLGTFFVGTWSASNLASGGYPISGVITVKRKA